ncbi:MAG: DUF4328 domain-containing protein [Acidimicrobiales bacterium]
MSDNPMGPDWWLASDGKWYPPTSRPGASPTPVVEQGPADSPPSPDWWLASDGKWYPPSLRPGASSPGYGAPVSVNPMLAGWLQGLLYASAALAVLALVFTLRALSTFNDHQDGQSRFRAWSEAHDDQVAGLGLLYLAMLATGILMIIWTYKASQTADRLGPGGRTWGPGWAIGGWFIPFASLVIPKLVLNEIERVATAPRSGAQVVAAWRRQSTSALGWIWWLTFVAGSVLMAASFAFEDPDTLLRSASDIRAGYTLAALATVCFAVSGVLGALFVRKLSQYLSPHSLDPSDDYWY